ncbi:MAG: 1-acyl-sn-glycerol-3-phosphate acyltransferase [Clostridia bacterium]|nr:1-acyl-sn-glycerol-3-phosphate acyltransferase [Clostridia bacterium]
MKIKMKRMTYDEVMALPRPRHRRPLRPDMVFRTIIRVGSIPALIKSKFSYTTQRMEFAGKGPWLVLMNHSCFMDLKIASKILYPKPFCTVCTSDGFVGKNWLMRVIGCIPTQKFVSDLSLIRDILYAVREKKTSVLMYPEAGYSFDGRATPLPRKLGVLLKKLDVPVVTITSKGAFARDPLYNGLQLRKVKVSAHVQCLLTPEEIREKSVDELDRMLDDVFTFDNFRWQQENNVIIDEPFRADGLHRLLYQCPHCGTEGQCEGKGIHWTCHACGKQYELTENGFLSAVAGETCFSHVPDWYDWQREQVRKEIAEGRYRLETDVEIGLLVDHKALYIVGDGHLSHSADGFVLTGCEGKLHYTQPPIFSYSLNSDYFWYEIGDVISIGDRNCLYYCFPKDNGISVAKARIATEELYKIAKEAKNAK